MMSRSWSWSLVATLVVALGLATGACSKKDDDKGKDKTSKTKSGDKGDKDDKGDKPSGDKTSKATDPAVAKAAAIADKMCACKDVACATGVREEYKKWAVSWGKTNPDVSLIKQVNVHSTRLGKCYKQLKTAK